MKFNRYPHRSQYRRPVTKRRIAAAERALKREQDKFPLLGDWIASQQPTARERVEHFNDANAKRFQRRRDGIAETWRKARTELRKLPKAEQERLIAKWDASPQPKDAWYFADFLTQNIPGLKERELAEMEEEIKRRKEEKLREYNNSRDHL